MLDIELIPNNHSYFINQRERFIIDTLLTILKTLQNILNWGNKLKVKKRTFNNIFALKIRFCDGFQTIMYKFL